MTNLEIKLQFSAVLPKAKEAPEDRQDACDHNGLLGRYAIADGVGNSFFPSEWANLLVEYFCHDPSKSNIDLFHTQNWKDWLVPIQNKWEKEIRKVIARASGSRLVRLRNDLNAGKPAASTFIGLQFNLGNTQILPLQFLIIGDSCMFHITKDRNFFSIPFTSSSQFSKYPECIFSKEGVHKHEPKFGSKNLAIGDILILTTDAFSKWILEQHEKDLISFRNTIQKLILIRTYDEFYNFVCDSRNSTNIPLEDDDVSLVVLRVIESEKIIDAGNNKGYGKINVDPERIRYRGVQPSKDGDETQNPLFEEKTKSSFKGIYIFITAIVISILSISLSLYTLISAKYSQSSKEVIPNITQTSVQIPPSPLNELPITPTENIQTNITLPKDSLIYLNPDIYSQPRLYVKQEFETSVMEKVTVNDGDWVKLGMVLWAQNQVGLEIFDNRLNVKIPIEVFLQPNDTSEVYGILQRNLYEIKQTHEALGSIWYKIYFEGYYIDLGQVQ